MASLINVNGNVFLSISGSKPIPLGIKATGDTASFKASLQSAYGRVSSKLSPTQKIEFGMLMNAVMKSSNPLSMIKSGISRVAGPSGKVTRIARSMAKLLRAAGKTIKSTPSAKTGPVSKPAPKIKLKIMRVDAGVVRKLLSGGPAAKPVMEGLAKNPQNLEALEKYLSAGKGKARKQLTESLFGAFQKIGKFNDAFDSIPLQAPKGLTILRKAADGKSIDELSLQEKTAMLRYYLYSYVLPGNPAFKEKLGQLGVGAQLKADQQNQGKPLDSQLLVSAAAYIYGRKSGNDLSKLDLKSALAPAVAEEEKAPEKPKPLRIAVIGDSITGVAIEREGKKVYQKSGFVYILDSLLKKTAKDSVVDPYGEKGQQVADIAKRFSSNLSGKGYNIVIIQGGVNDAYDYNKDQSKSKDIIDRVEANLKKMVAAARSLGMEPIVLTIHPHTRDTQTDIVKDRINEINKRIRAITGARVIELPMLEGPLHQVNKGNIVIANLIMKELAEGSKTSSAVPAESSKKSKAQQDLVAKANALADYVTKGDPVGLYKAYKDFAAKASAKAFETVMKLTAQRIFNQLKNDQLLKIFFVREGGDRYNTNVGDPTFRFITDEVHKDYSGKGMAAIVDFLNWRAGHKIADYKLKNLEWDLKALNMELGREGKTKLETSTFQNALIGAALYNWRKNNRDAEPGSWAKALHPEKKPSDEDLRVIR